MKTWAGILVGAMGLAILDAVLSSSSGAANAGGFIEGIGNFVEDFISVSVPAFKVSTSPSSSSTTTTTTTTPQATDAVQTTTAKATPALSPAAASALGGGVPVDI